METAQLMWPYVERNIERLVGIFEDSNQVAREWKPPAPGANSLAALVNHTLGNAEDNLLGTICGEDVNYERQTDFDGPDTDPAGVRNRWESIRARFAAALPRLTDATMLTPIEHPRRGGITRFETLLVVARHTSEHLAHAELTRDLYRASRRDA